MRHPPTSGEERRILTGLLDAHRAALLRAVTGVDEARLRWTPAASDTTLVGLVWHLTQAETWWFRVVLDRQDVTLPWSPRESRALPRVPEGAAPGEVVAAYRAEIARSRVVVARHELDEVVAFRSRRFSARWILLHMISETARHSGQASLLRELIDGSA